MVPGGSTFHMEHGTWNNKHAPVSFLSSNMLKLWKFLWGTQSHYQIIHIIGSLPWFFTHFQGGLTVLLRLRRGELATKWNFSIKI